MTRAPGPTILACSSPPGHSARALIRIDGPSVEAVLAALVRDPPTEPRRVVTSRLRPPLPGLPVLCVRFAAPASYTGNDVAELQVPGHPALIERVLNAGIAARHDPSHLHAVRLAQPGEFTFRAYLNGKLDLTRAEGIAATIAARCDAELRAAAQLRQGRLGAFAHDLVDRLATGLALLEAGIDFTDQDDVVPITPTELGPRVDEITRQLNDLLAHCRRWGELDTLPRVVLVGPPSAGKSTLFNALLRRERAVVDPLPGTTRDVLVEHLTLPTTETGLAEDLDILLCDLAGLDTLTIEAEDKLSRDIQIAARAAVDRADLILRCAPADATAPDNPAHTPGLRSDTPMLQVVTKADLAPSDVPSHDDAAVCISASTGAGLDTLRRALGTRLRELGHSANARAAESLALQPRHEATLRAAADALGRAGEAIAHEIADDPRHFAQPELVADALREALDHLAALGGDMTPDDVIGKVFAAFCVGK